MNPLQQLLGSAAASQVASPDVIPAVEGSIDVSGDRFNPLDNMADVSDRDVAILDSQDASDHRGLFGVKGTLRDVLGLVGDAFLVQGGGRAIYGPKREQEKLSDAMAGFTNDQKAASERAAGIDPTVGYKMYDDFLVREDRKAKAAQDAATHRIRETKNRNDLIEEGRAQAAQLVNAAIASGNPQALQSVMAQVERMAAAYNLTLPEVGITPEMSEEALGIFAQAGMTPYQQQRVPQMDRGLDIRQQNADERGRNNRVRSGIANRRADTAERRADTADRAETRRSEEGKSPGGRRPLKVNGREFTVTRQ